jgi:hypothetical protein
MRRIKAVLFAGTAFTAALLAQSASAADQPPLVRSEPPLAAPSHWEGLYASVSAGGTWPAAALRAITQPPKLAASGLQQAVRAA